MCVFENVKVGDLVWTPSRDHPKFYGDSRGWGHMLQVSTQSWGQSKMGAGAFAWSKTIDFSEPLCLRYYFR